MICNYSESTLSTQKQNQRSSNFTPKCALKQDSSAVDPFQLEQAACLALSNHKVSEPSGQELLPLAQTTVHPTILVRAVLSIKSSKATKSWPWLSSLTFRLKKEAYLDRDKFPSKPWWRSKKNLLRGLFQCQKCSKWRHTRQPILCQTLQTKRTTNSLWRHQLKDLRLGIYSTHSHPKKNKSSNLLAAVSSVKAWKCL